MEFLENTDRQLLLFFNGHNAPWLDVVMKAISSFWIWYPIVALFVFLSVKYFRKQFWIPILFAVICFVITDQSTNIIKNNVKRYRPTHNTEICDKVHVVDDYRGGQYGFFSSHAANSFGLAFLTLLFFRKKYYTITVFIWAVLVSFSRIYLGVHYPSDVLVGAVFGITVAYVVYYLRNKIFCCRIQNQA